MSGQNFNFLNFKASFALRAGNPYAELEFQGLAKQALHSGLIRVLKQKFLFY